jgi:predicted short-subunit dehydrogenase-like oxidoreductase (DUF2520 family)
MRRAPVSARRARSRWSAPDGSARLGSVVFGIASIRPAGRTDRLAVVNEDHGGAPAMHRHPHSPGDPRGKPRIGFIGAGRVGTALGVAFARAGWPVVAVSSRDAGRRERFRALVPDAAEVGSLASVADEADLLFLTVPDDALAEVAARLRLYAGQAAVHTSGALSADVLEPARAAGSATGSFHPLVAFADQDTALAGLQGATVALEGDEGLMAILARLATDIGAQPVRLPPSGKQAYHAAAVLAAGGFVGLLDGIAEVARGAGLDEAGALAIYAPLIRQSLGNAERLGLEAALTGPFVRGDEGTVRSHLAALARLAPGALELYRAVARRELAMAVHRGAIDEARAAGMRHLLDDG